jgi:hypothetical protein
MTTGDKAKRATVAIGSSSVEGFQMPGGSYRMRQSGATTTINEPPVCALRFLTSMDSKASLGQAFTDYTPEQIEVEQASAELYALREQVARLEQQLHDAGLEPWQLPQTER